MRADGIEGSVIEAVGWLKTYFDAPKGALPEQMIAFMLTLKRGSAVK